MLLFTLFLFSSGLFLQCGPAVSPITTAAIIEVESGGNANAIGDNTQRKSYAPKTKADAIRIASLLLVKGHNLDLGLMQVNSSHLKTFNLTPADLFDPCTNIKVGTKILADYYRHFNTTPDKDQVLFRALSAYNTGSGWRGPAYINRILAAVNAPYRVRLKKEQQAKESPLPSPQNSAIFFETEGNIIYNPF